MMRFESKVKYLSIALVMLLLAWAAGEFFAPERVATRSEMVSLLSAKPAEVASVDLSAAGKELHLARTGGQWTLVDGADRLPVQSSRVDALVAALAKAGRKRPIATGKEAWKNLGLDEAMAKEVKLSDAVGKPLLDLHAGNYGSTGSELYVRLGSSDASYTVDGSIASWLGADRGSWLDRRLFQSAADANSVQAFSIAADLVLDPAAKPVKPLKASWRFERTGEGWKGSARTLDAVSIESALRGLLNLEAADLLARAPGDAFAHVGATVKVELGSGKERMVEVGSGAGNGRFWIRASEGGQASPLGFQVSSYSLGAFLKDEDGFVKK